MKNTSNKNSKKSKINNKLSKNKDKIKEKENKKKKKELAKKRAYKVKKNEIYKDDLNNHSGDDNIVKLNPNIKRQNFIPTKNFIIFLVIFLLCLIGLVIRLFYIQFFQGSWLKELAYNQQTTTEVISAKRGDIYDTNGKALAIGAEVDTITINPSLFIKDTDEETLEYQTTIATALSTIFELDYDSTYTKVTSSSSYQTVARQVSQDKVDLLTTWMSENNIYSGITIESDNTRSYPYDTVASAVIGFCNYDNQGAYGIEETWNDVLSGTSGKLVSSTDTSAQKIPNSEETYIPAEDGYDITLTIDLNIQMIVEKYLEQAVDNNGCEGGRKCYCNGS